MPDGSNPTAFFFAHPDECLSPSASINALSLLPTMNNSKSRHSSTFEPLSVNSILG